MPVCINPCFAVSKFNTSFNVLISNKAQPERLYNDILRGETEIKPYNNLIDIKLGNNENVTFYRINYKDNR